MSLGLGVLGCGSPRRERLPHLSRAHARGREATGTRPSR